MKKVKLFGIGNEEKLRFNHYEFEKTNQSVKIISDILEEVFDCGIQQFLLGTKKDGREFQKRRNFEKIADEMETLKSFSKDKTRIDIFFGKKTFLLIIICDEKKRKEFNAKIEKVTKMKKEKFKK